jgi:hypothetical protein
MDRKNNFAEKALARTNSAVQSKPPSAAEPSTDADFKSFILYVSSADKRSAQCIKALEALSLNSSMKLDTLIQDVDALASRPTWLDSVPCIVIKSEKKALKDDACVRFIIENKHKGLGISYSKQRGHRSKVIWD